MKTWKRIVMQYPLEHLEKLECGARDAGLSRSAFIVRTMRDALDQDEVAGKLFRSPAFRSSVAELVTRPEVMKHIVSTMGDSAEVPSVVRRQVEQQFELMANPRPKPKKSPRTKRKA